MHLRQFESCILYSRHATSAVATSVEESKSSIANALAWMHFGYELSKSAFR